MNSIPVPTIPTDAALTMTVVQEDSVDPFTNEHHARVTRELNELAQMGRTHYGDEAGPKRKRTSTIDWTNPATMAVAARLPTFRHWLQQMPTAAALHPLYNPETEAYTTGSPMDDEIRHWFRNIADAQGIRSRARILRRLLVDQLPVTGRGEWLSLACGAAQPVIQAMAELAASGGSPRTTLVDLDRNALANARSLARRHGVTGHVRTLRRNILGLGGLGKGHWVRRQSTWTDRFDAVDAVGILEYLLPDDWIYSYNGVVASSRTLAGAITFLRHAFTYVKPGGTLIVGNMLDTHPQLGFTMDVVQWPHIQPRSVETMMKIFEAAGLEGHADVHLTSDGVYAIYGITKRP